jgi:hypothetical protein
MKDFKSLPKMKTGGRVRKYEAGGGVQSYESAKKEVTPEAKREQTKKMRPPTANESSALDLNRRQYKLGKEWAETDPKNDKTTVDYVRRESGAPKLQSLSTFKQVPEEARDYEAYKDAGYKRGGKVKRGKTKK